MFSFRGPRQPALALLAAAVLATTGACGTTVAGPDSSLQGQSGTALGSGDSLGAPDAQLDASGSPLPTEIADGSTTGPELGGTTTDPTVPTGQGGTPSTDPTQGTPSGGAGPETPGKGEPIEVGYLVTKDVGAAFDALGFSLSSGDGATQAKAAVKLVNDKGGVGGHQIEPVIFEIDPTGDINAQFTEACAFFFEDNQVAAVVAVYNDDKVRACGAQRGVPVVDPNTAVPLDTLNRFPNIVQSGQPTTETAAAGLVDGLVKAGWFKPTSATEIVRIGLLTHDGAKWEGIPGLVESKLEAAGLDLTSTFKMPEGDIGAASTAGGAAALRFRSEGVNRLLAVDKGGFALSWFGVSAATQGYYPRLGMSSLSNPALEPTVLSPQALAGSAGIGWSPIFDTVPKAQPSTSPRTGACLTAMTEAGEDMNTGGARQGGLMACDGTFMLADAWAAGETTLTAFLKGAKALGTTYQSVTTFATDFGRSRAGADAYRTTAYSAACDCFSYTGPTTKFPR